MGHRYWRLLVLNSLALCLSCSEHSNENSHSFQISESDGSSYATTTGGSLYQVDPFRYEEVLRLSEFGLRDEYYFVQPVRRFLADDEGRLYITDNGDLLLYQFDQSGNLLMTIGGEGDGPGEFRSIEIIDVTDDRIITFDFTLQRASVFSQSGALLDTYHAPSHSGRLQRMNVLQDGVITCSYIEVIMDGDYQYTSESLLIMAPQGTLSDISLGPVITGYRYPGGMASMPFSGYPQLLYSPIHGIISGTGEDPTIQLYDIKGSHYKTIQTELEQRMITSEVKSRYLRAIRRIAENDPSVSGRKQIHDALDNIEFPLQSAFWNFLQTDSSGFIWLRTPTDEPDPLKTSGAEYRVLDPHGEFIGTTQWPIPGGFISNGYLLAWDSHTESEHGYTALVYRIIPNVDGLMYP